MPPRRDSVRAMSSDARESALPFGSWPTPITSRVVVARAVGLSEAQVDGGDVLWSESRPAEGGRTALVRRASDGSTAELLPEDGNARTAVHEYGGGAWWARDGVVWFASWSDQRLYRRDPETGGVEALTPEPATPRGDRYADGSVSPDGEWIACVREHHPPGGRGAVDVRNEVVRLAAHRRSTPEVLVSGPDFVSDPRWSPDGKRLCWIEWDHPNMPWDGTRLKVRDVAGGENTLVAGGELESVCEPRWQDDGSLAFISDRTGWWTCTGSRRRIARVSRWFRQTRRSVYRNGSSGSPATRCSATVGWCSRACGMGSTVSASDSPTERSRRSSCRSRRSAASSAPGIRRW